jgi:hypothetical protein
MSRFRNLKAANRKDWLWKPNQGEPMRPRDMTTAHLVNALRMIVYNSEDRFPTPIGLKIGIWPSVKSWNPKYVTRAKKEFIKELSTREDFTGEELFAELL